MCCQVTSADNDLLHRSHCKYLTILEKFYSDSIVSIEQDFGDQCSGCDMQVIREWVRIDVRI